MSRWHSESSARSYNVRIYRARYPEEVGALALLDTAHEDQREHTLAAETEGGFESARQVPRRRLGDPPLVVLTARRSFEARGQDGDETARYFFVRRISASPASPRAVKPLASSYNSYMKRASITEAKNRLSALIDHVRQGESVIIEDRGVPVAQLNPVATRGAGADQARVARLVRQGILRPAVSTAAGRFLATAPPKSRRRVSLSRLVIEERRNSR